MQIHSHVTLDAYLEYLRGPREKSVALLNDLLIGVTNFFRDPAAWDALAHGPIPIIFKRKDPAEQVRVWSIGCATGEEAYSLAILLIEYANSRENITKFRSSPPTSTRSHWPERVRVSILRPSKAMSARSASNDSSIRQDNHYQVRRELRDMVLFTNHSILRDPPFSRQDLVCCRNLLIYMQHEIQQYVIDVFHYAAQPGGLFIPGRLRITVGGGRIIPADRQNASHLSGPAREVSSTFRPSRLRFNPWNLLRGEAHVPR